MISQSEHGVLIYGAERMFSKRDFWIRSFGNDSQSLSVVLAIDRSGREYKAMILHQIDEIDDVILDSTWRHRLGPRSF